MRYMIRWLVLALTLTLGACAHMPPPNEVTLDAAYNAATYR